MPRLQDQANIGYVATPDAIRRILPTWLTFDEQAYHTLRVLDPAIGRGAVGEIVARLCVPPGQLAPRADWIRSPKDRDAHATSRYRRPSIEIYGIELHPERRAEARAICAPQACLRADFFETRIADEMFSLVFCNPPYGYPPRLQNDEGPQERWETRFLRRCLAKLQAGGILVWIVPQDQIGRDAGLLASWCDQLRCWRFPDDPWTADDAPSGIGGQPMYAAYHQVILIGVRRSQAVPPDPATLRQLLAWAGSGADLAPFQARAEPQEPFVIPGCQAWRAEFIAQPYHPGVPAMQLLAGDGGLWNDDRYQRDHFPVDDDQIVYEPFMPPLMGHIATLATIGLADGEVTGQDGRRIIVKGTCEKREVTVIDIDEEGTETETRTERFETEVYFVDPVTGQWGHVSSGDQPSALEGWPCEETTWDPFLANYGPALAATIARRSPARYRPRKLLDWLPERCFHRPGIGVQDYAAEAIAQAIRGERSPGGYPRYARFMDIGEPGTTKTAIAIKAVLFASEPVHGGICPPEQRPAKRDFTPVLVYCPGNLVEQWREEVLATIPGASVVILTKIDSDAAAADFRRFDLTWTGKRLSLMGCIDRVAARIQADLTTWQARCHEGRASEAPLPRKPAIFAILSYTDAKLSSAWQPRYVVHRLITRCIQRVPVETASAETHQDGQAATVEHVGYRQDLVLACPRCGTPLGPQVGDKSNSVYLALDGIDDRAKRRCQACQEPLWQQTPVFQPQRFRPRYPPERGARPPVTPLPLPDYDHQRGSVVRDRAPLTSTADRRWAGARYLRDRYPGLFSTIIADEAHKLGAETSAQGSALDDLILAAGPRGTLIGLTGTLKDYPSTQFQFLQRFSPQVRRRFPHGSAGLRRWVAEFGTEQRIVIRPAQREDGALTDRREVRRVVQELPGFSPMTILFQDNAVFVKLAHIAPGLPPFREEVVSVPMGSVLGPAYRAFQEEATRALGQQLHAGDKSALSSWFHAMQILPNLPMQRLVVRNARTGEVLAASTPLPGDTLSPKERVLLELVRFHLAQGRPCCILVENSTDRYDVPGRLYTLITADAQRWAAGLPPDAGPNLTVPELPACPPELRVQLFVLRSDTVKGRDRQQWIRTQLGQGGNILICHSALIEVGMNLPFPTMISMQTCYDTCRARQVVRRSYRPWQRLPVQVYHLTYQGAAEAHGLQLVAEKARAAMMSEGDLPDTGLAAWGEGASSLKIALARRVLAGMEESQATGSLERLFADIEQRGRMQQAFLGSAFLNAAMEAPTSDLPSPVREPEPVEQPEQGAGALGPQPEPAHEATPSPLPVGRSWDDPAWRQLPPVPRAKKPHGPSTGHLCALVPVAGDPRFRRCVFCGKVEQETLGNLPYEPRDHPHLFVALSQDQQGTWQVECYGEPRMSSLTLARSAQRHITEDPDRERRERRQRTLKILSVRQALREHPMTMYRYRQELARRPQRGRVASE